MCLILAEDQSPNDKCFGSENGHEPKEVRKNGGELRRPSYGVPPYPLFKIVVVPLKNFVIIIMYNYLPDDVDDESTRRDVVYGPTRVKSYCRFQGLDQFD